MQENSQEIISQNSWLSGWHADESSVCVLWVAARDESYLLALVVWKSCAERKQSYSCLLWHHVQQRPPSRPASLVANLCLLEWRCEVHAQKHRKDHHLPSDQSWFARRSMYYHVEERMRTIPTSKTLCPMIWKVKFGCVGVLLRVECCSMFFCCRVVTTLILSCLSENE